MNHWKRVWETYHREATKRAYVRELWRLSGWGTRSTLVLGALVLVWGAFELLDKPWQEWPWRFMCGELTVLAVFQHMKDTIFRRVYGSADEDFSPSEDGGHQIGRFLIFKRQLREAGLTKSHVEDLFDLVDAKDDLESQRNTLVNKLWLFVSGFFTALAITIMRGLSQEVAFKVVIWLIVACAFLVPLLWLFPSRKESLKELRYFMLLYCKGLGE